MKRIDNLYSSIYTVENLECAEILAQKGKGKQYGVQSYNKNRDRNFEDLRQMLMHKKFRTSEYKNFTIHEPKERLIFRLPFYPDRITQHAAMNVLKPHFMKLFTSDSYGNIEGRGVHKAANRLKMALRNRSETTYCLKVDIKKFYPSVDHEILKSLLRRKIKDYDMLSFLDEIIDSAPGLPIGNYLSQYMANYYLTFFDHWIKEHKGIKYYFRYVDDMVFLSSSKQELHQLLSETRTYLSLNLNLLLKDNYQVFPVAARGIDFLGYVFFHTHTLLRKPIKQNFARAVARKANMQTLASYGGWAKHCNSKHLMKKLGMKQFAQLGIKSSNTGFTGDKIKVEKILNTKIVVLSFKIDKSKFPEKTSSGDCLFLQIEFKGEKRVVFTGSSGLMDQIRQVNPSDFPFETTITKEDERYQFN